MYWVDENTRVADDLLPKKTDISLGVYLRGRDPSHRCARVKMENLNRKLASLELSESPNDHLTVSLSQVEFDRIDRALVSSHFLINNNLRVGDCVIFCTEADQRYIFQVWPTALISSKEISICPDYASFCRIKEGDQLTFIQRCTNIKHLRKIEILADRSASLILEGKFRNLFLKFASAHVGSLYVFEDMHLCIESIHDEVGNIPFGAFHPEWSKITLKSSEMAAKSAELEMDTDCTVLNKISSLTRLSRNHKELRVNMIKPVRGILLASASRASKIQLGKNLACALDLPFIYFDGTDFRTSFLGNFESSLWNKIEEISPNSPCLLFIDEIDFICPKRQQTMSGSVENRSVTFFLTLLDSSNKLEGSLVVAACEKLDSIDEALRRPGRFDVELQLNAPSKIFREQMIMKNIHTLPHQLTGNEMSAISSSINGYSASDIFSLIREAAIFQIKTKSLLLSFDHLNRAISLVKASAIRNMDVEVPETRWSDIAGQSAIKEQLRVSVLEPLGAPQKFQKIGISPPKGILLYGPPGCSKTMLAKALAYESGLSFVYVKGPEIFSKWVGDSEKAIREIFQRARTASPSIIFFDEFDAIGARNGTDSGHCVQDRVICQLLSEMDGIEPLHNVVVLAATNRPDIIDSSLLRPGRLDRHLCVGLPDKDAISIMLKKYLEQFEYIEDIAFFGLIEKLIGYSGAEICQIFTEVSHSAMRDNRGNPYSHYFNEVLCRTAPKTSNADLQYYNSFSLQKYH